MLERCTPGPWSVDGKYISAMTVEYEPIVCTVREAEEGLRTSQQVKANAQLLALAYDHALWGAAVARGLAEMKVLRVGDTRQTLLVEVARKMHPVEMDPFACPLLTPELRAALCAALEIK